MMVEEVIIIMKTVQRHMLVGASLALVCCGVNAEPRNFQAVYTNLDAHSKDTDNVYA